MLETFNPIFFIFLSYGLGALGTAAIKLLGFFSWFEDHNYIGDKLTKRLGVLAFGWLIRKSFMGKFNTKLYLEGKFNLQKLQQLKEDMTDAENSHLIAFVLFQLYILLIAIWGFELWQIVAYTISNIVFNLYLVFLQQYNKRRIERVINVAERRKACYPQK